VVYANLAATALLPFAIRVMGVWACIALAACARVATRLMLIYGKSILVMQFLEVSYSFFSRFILLVVMEICSSSGLMPVVLAVWVTSAFVGHSVKQPCMLGIYLGILVNISEYPFYIGMYVRFPPHTNVADLESTSMLHAFRGTQSRKALACYMHSVAHSCGDLVQLKKKNCLRACLQSHSVRR
jgi:hypothetical protein